MFYTYAFLYNVHVSQLKSNETNILIFDTSKKIYLLFSSCTLDSSLCLVSLISLCIPTIATKLR